MSERWVVNASPLIALGRIGRLDLLAALADEVVIPEDVVSEVERGGDDASAYVRAAPLRVIQVAADPRVVSWGLGLGETAVLSMAKAQAGLVAILDDLAARRCASALGIPTRGTVGVVLLAKTRQVIPSAAAVLADLGRAGLYLSPNLVAHALSLVGEQEGE